MADWSFSKTRRGRRGDDEPREDDIEAPNNLERALGEFLADKPTLQSILDYVGQIPSAASNVLRSAVNAAQGDTEKAGQNLLNAAKNIGGLAAPLPFIERSAPETRSSGVDVLKDAGVGTLGVADLPLIGKVSGRGALGLGMDIATDPLRFARIARLTNTGEAAAKVGNLTPTMIPTPEQAMAGVRRLSDLGAQAAAGERALVGFRVPGTDRVVSMFRGQKVLDIIGKTRDSVRGSLIGRAFSTAGSLPESVAIREAGLSARAMTSGPLEAAYVSVRNAIENEVKAAGGSFDDVLERVSELTEYVDTQKPRTLGANPPRPLRQVSQQDAVKAARYVREVSDKLDKRLSGLDRISHYERQRALQLMLDTPGLVDEPNGVWAAVMAARNNRVYADILHAEQALGAKALDLADEALSYQFHAITPEARALMQQRHFQETFSKRLESWFQSAPQKARNEAWRGKPIKEINDWWEKLPDTKNTKLFETDPDIIIRGRLHRTANIASSRGAIDRAVEIFGDTASDARKIEGWVPAQVAYDAVGLKGVRAPGVVLPPEVAQELNRVVRVVRSPETPSAFLKVVDASMSAFKSGVTSIFPQFHARNHISNVWANFLAGVWKPKHYNLSARIMADARKIAKAGGDGRVWQIGGRTVTTRQIVQEMTDHRALGYGAMSPDELGSVLRAKKGESKFASAGKYAFRKGQHFGEQVENFSKVAHYVAKLDEGFNPESAAASAKKYLFDYGDLTVFEKSVMKRVVPFYTFFRKNLPLQLESLVTQPGKVSMLGHFQRAMQARAEGDGGVDTAYVPDWVRRRLWGVAEKDGGETSTLSGLGIGFEEVAIFDRPLQEALVMLRPEIKGLMQAATNRDLFRDTALSKSDSAPSSLRWLQFVPGGGAFLDWLEFRAVDEAKGRYRANPKRLNALMSLGFVGSTSRALNTGNSIERALSDDNAGAAALRLVTGVREDTLSPEERIRANLYDVIRARKEELDKLVLSGTAAQYEVYGVRRDAIAVDPRVERVREINRELAQLRRAIRELDPTTTSELARSTFRSGGR